jgi:hypothetical protein
MKRVCEFYIKRAKLIGVLYCTIPTTAWLIYILLTAPYRWIYILRFVLCLTFGNIIGAHLNQYGLRMWLSKHSSDLGPANIIDGAYNGAAVGFGIALLTALTSFIGTNHPEMAKTFVIVAYVAATLLGAIVGSVVAMIGRKYLNRDGTFRNISPSG